jgi:hypothetical protein
MKICPAGNRQLPFFPPFVFADGMAELLSPARLWRKLARAFSKSENGWQQAVATQDHFFITILFASFHLPAWCSTSLAIIRISLWLLFRGGSGGCDTRRLSATPSPGSTPKNKNLADSTPGFTSALWGSKLVLTPMLYLLPALLSLRPLRPSR